VPSLDSTYRIAQARCAAAMRYGHADADDLQRDLRAIRLERQIRRAVDQTPPLTATQRDRLVRLLGAA
jgi:hypothetical protein